MKNKDYKWTYSEVLERFEAIEKELSLDKSIIQGVPWWDTLRYRLFNELLIKLVLSENLKKNITLKSRKSLAKKILTIIHILKTFIKFLSPKSPLWMKKNSNVILGHPRKKFEVGVYIDPYSDPFIDLFPKTINFSVIEEADGNKTHRSPAKTKNLFYADLLPLH